MPIATALLLVASNAFARIGETENEIEARYGKPFTADSRDFNGYRLVIFRTSGMQIGVAFRDGKSAAEFYSKQDSSDISANEIQVILAANAAGGKWTKAPAVPMWTLDSTGCVATLSANGRTLTVFTKGFINISAAEREKAEKEKLKSF